MHATQPQGGACPEPHDGDHATNFFADLLGDDEKFRTWVAAAATPVIPPHNPEADGYVVTDAGIQALADTGEAPGTAGSVLRCAALYLERHGWIQGAYYDPTATVFTPAADMVGAIGMVCYGGPVEAPAQHFSDPGFLDFEEAVLHLDRFLLVEDGSESYEFNDAKGRTLDQVTDVLRQAAARTAEELIDVLRAINADNAETADRVKLLIPRGIWGGPAASRALYADDMDIVDCLFCGATGGYPYCQGSFGGGMSCAEVAAAYEAAQAAQDDDGGVQCPSCGRRVPVIDGRFAIHLRHPSTPTVTCDGSDCALPGGDAR